MQIRRYEYNKGLSVRCHTCPCSASLHRDHNAARKIFDRAGLVPQATVA